MQVSKISVNDINGNVLEYSRSNLEKELYMRIISLPLRAKLSSAVRMIRNAGALMRNMTILISSILRGYVRIGWILMLPFNGDSSKSKALSGITPQKYNRHNNIPNRPKGSNLPLFRLGTLNGIARIFPASHSERLDTLSGSNCFNMNVVVACKTFVVWVQ